jgi:hypothetical protein
LTDKDRAQGWSTPDNARVFGFRFSDALEYRDDWKVAYSPRITSIHGLPNEDRHGACPGFDEWYIFEQPPAPAEMEVFVNWVGFRLYEPVYQWCADRLWDQVARFSPESYLADGTVLTFATRNRELFDKAIAAMAADQ